MNIGVLGSGFIANIFVENSKMYKDFKLYAIWGRHEEKIKKFDGFKVYTTNLNEFLSDPNIDVVYVALPNSLHYEYAYLALKAGKHVMLEKPFCQNQIQAKALIKYAKKHKLLLFETIMTKYIPAYNKSMTYLDSLGDIRIIDMSFCQYSRKYDKFKNGEILPAFNYKLAGGALMDIGVYMIHYVVGMFGKPKKVEYKPNIERNVDTSGILYLDYGKFKATLVCGKDCKAPAYALVQGDKGYIKCNSTVSRCANYEIVLNNGETKRIKGIDEEFAGWKPMYGEFIKLYKNKDFEKCYEYLNETLIVQQVLDKARESAKLKF